MKKLLLCISVFLFFTFLTQAQSVNNEMDTSCIHGQGYWKNHSDCKTNGNGNSRDETWDLIEGYDINGNPSVGEQTIFFKSNQDYCEVFDTNPGKGGKYYILAHKYITTQLNILGTPNSLNSNNIFDESTIFLSRYTPKEVDDSKDLQAESVRLSSTLAGFSSTLYCNDIEPPIIGVLSTPANIEQTSLTLNWTAATDNVGVTGYNVYKDGLLETTLGNVLTVSVTSLTPNTNYDFYVTAFDAQGNESGPSNVQNVTTSSNTLKITIETTSTSASWTPTNITNSGQILKWEVTGGVTIPEESINLPSFDLSGNTGVAIITATSDDDLDGLTEVDIRGLIITSLDVNNATALTSLIAFSNQLSSIDVSGNINLTRLRLQSNNLSNIDVSQNTLLTQLTLSNNSISTINLASNINLDILQLDRNSLSQVDISNNSLLTDFQIYQNNLPSVELDKIVNDLASFSLTNGNLQIIDNAGSLTTASLASYLSLTADGWSIDVPPPTTAPDTEPPVIGTLNVPTAVVATSLSLDWTAATDNVGVTGYNVYKNGLLDATLGDILTTSVTSLTPNTNYNFYVTAFDEQGNESGPSNVQNVTTSSNSLNITIETSSTSASWTPTNISNSGQILKWEVTGGVTIPEESINLPSFDLSGNTGVAIITATSDDDLGGLTEVDIRGLNVTSLEVSNATALTSLLAFSNQLSSIDVSSNINLTRLRLQSNDLSDIDVSQNTLLTQLTLSNNSISTINLDSNINLNILQLDRNSLSEVDISNNTLLTDFQIYQNNLTTIELDEIVNVLGGFGLSDGNLQIVDNAGDLTSSSFITYVNLIDKGWTIDVPAPTSNKIIASKVSIYPNPISSEGEVSFKATSSGVAEVKLYGSTGQIIGTLFYGETTTEKDNVLEYDLNKLAQGMYFAVFKIDNEIIRKKILITK